MPTEELKSGTLFLAFTTVLIIGIPVVFFPHAICLSTDAQYQHCRIGQGPFLIVTVGGMTALIINIWIGT